jgi:hypothetical protein
VEPDGTSALSKTLLKKIKPGNPILPSNATTDVNSEIITPKNQQSQLDAMLNAFKNK